MVATSGMDTARVLRPYLPRVAIRALAEAPAPHVALLPGTLVFADVSGFTKLSERLARLGAEGAERISEAIGTSFTSLLAVAYANGGGLLKFGGDALLLFFEGDEHAERALRAAVGMRRALRAAGPVVAPGARTTLRMSMGVHSGTLALCLAGRSHREPVVAGPAVTTTLRMEKAASAGEIVLSPSLAATLPARLVGAPRGPGLLLRAAPRGPDFAPAEPPLPAGAPIADGVPVAVRRHVLGGGGAPEHRLVTVAFVRYAGVDALVERAPYAAGAALDALLTVAQLACEEHEVALLGADGEADGGKLMLVAGAPRAVGDEEERMLLTLRAIADAGGSLPLQLGVNRGRAFTGDIGPDYRRTYTAMGDVTNLAARLAAKAPAGGIYATAGVLDALGRCGSTLTRIPPLTLKGKARPVDAWSVGAARGRERGSERRERRDARGARPRARAAARPCSRRRAAARGRYVELAGPPGIGKTQLVETMRAEAARADHPARDLRAARRRRPVRRLARAPAAADRRGLGRPGDGVVVARLRAAVAERAHDLEPWLPLLAATLGVELPDTPAVAALVARVPRRPAARRGRPLPRRIAARRHGARDRARPRHGRRVGRAARRRARRAARAPVADPAHPPRRAVGRRAPARRPGRTALALDPLDARGRARARAPPHRRHAAAAAGARARRRAAAGNPQFLRDLLAAAAAGDDALTETLEAAATARIDRLDPRDRTLVRHAAVLGMSFHPRTLDDGGVATPTARRRSSPTTAAGGCGSAAGSCARRPTPGCRSGRAGGCMPTRALAGGRGLGRARRARRRALAALLPRRRPPARLGLRARGGGARRARRAPTPTPRCCSGARSTPPKGAGAARRRHRGHLGRARRGAGAQRQLPMRRRTPTAAPARSPPATCSAPARSCCARPSSPTAPAARRRRCAAALRALRTLDGVPGDAAAAAARGCSPRWP